MFSLQIKTIFRVLGEALLTLANMPRSAEDTLDDPSVGADVERLETTDFAETSAATVFAPPPPEPAAVFAPTLYEMEAGFPHTREEMNAVGWTDDALIQAGHLVAVVPPKPIVPPSPPANVAPPPPSGQTGAQSNTAMIDSAGVTYDARIHAQTQTKTADGQWKKGRGIDPALIAQVLAEQKAGAPAPTPFVPLNSAPGVPGLASAAAIAPPPTPAGGAAITTPPTTFVDLCKWNNANKINAAAINDACTQLGVPGGFGSLAKPEYSGMIPNVYQLLKK